MSSPKLVLSRRLRKTPYEERVVEQNAKAYTIYNHMPLSSVYQTPEQDYAHLCEHVQIWDVSVERQVEVVGPDALALAELVTPRDLSICKVGQCMYAPLVDEFGGVVNDPIVLRLADDRFWFSIADSDVLLWLKGIAYGRSLDVRVFEPDVSPLAIQGPRADDLMANVVGEHVRDIPFFWFIETRIADTEVLLARSGWSGQGGYEIYLQDSAKGLDLWDTFWVVGQQYNIRAGCPNLIERLESGLMSYGSDMTLENNPLECGLERFCDLDKKAEFMSRDALHKINAQGVSQRHVHLMVQGEPAISPRAVWEVFSLDGKRVGQVTSLAYSVRYESNLSFAMVNSEYADKGRELLVSINGEKRACTVMSRKWTLG